MILQVRLQVEIHGRLFVFEWRSLTDKHIFCSPLRSTNPFSKITLLSTDFIIVNSCREWSNWSRSIFFSLLLLCERFLFYSTSFLVIVVGDPVCIEYTSYLYCFLCSLLLFSLTLCFLSWALTYRGDHLDV